MTPSASVETAPGASDLAVEITVRGRATVVAASLLKAQLLAAMASHPHVLVRLEVEKLDGAGLQLLLAARQQVVQAGGTLVVAHAGAAAEALALAGAEDLLQSSESSHA